MTRPAVDLAAPCIRVDSAPINGTVHTFESGYCSTHAKVMSCEHQCSAKFATPCACEAAP